MGVSGAACVGCLGCYWVKEAGDGRVPLPAAQRALSSLSIKVKSSAPLPPPWSGPLAVATDRRAAAISGRCRCTIGGVIIPAASGSGSLGSSTGAVFFLDFQRLYHQPCWKGAPRPGMTQAMSSSWENGIFPSPGDFGPRGGLARGKRERLQAQGSRCEWIGVLGPGRNKWPARLAAGYRIGKQRPC